MGEQLSSQEEEKIPEWNVFGGEQESPEASRLFPDNTGIGRNGFAHTREEIDSWKRK